MEERRAIITIKRANELSPREVRSLKRWLERSAKFLVSKDAKKSGFSKRLQFSFIQQQGD